MMRIEVQIKGIFVVRKRIRVSTSFGLWTTTLVLLVVGHTLFVGTSVFAESWSAQRCEANINRITGNHIKCLLDAESAYAKSGRKHKYEKRVASCEGRYAYAYERALQRWPGSLSFHSRVGHEAAGQNGTACW